MGAGVSIDVLTWVFKHSESTLSDRLVLLALADYAHDDGGSAYPQVATLAKKARVSERTVERCLDSLVTAGRIQQTGVTPRGGVRVWRVIMEPDNLSARQESKGDPTSLQKQPDNLSAPIREPSMEPSMEPSGPRKADKDDAPLSHLLSELLVASGVPSHKARVTKRWAEAEALLLDRDKRPLEEAEALLRWASVDPFWRANILSMPTFREKYDQIRLQRDRGGPRPAPEPEFYDG